MSAQESSSRWAQLRGILAGALLFPLIVVVGDILLGAALSTATPGVLLAGREDLLAQLALFVGAAGLAGIGCSVATGDYVSGTSILAISSGALLLSFGAAFASPPPGESLLGGEPTGLALALFMELLFGLGVILLAYFAAWQTDLHWVLPRRPGPPYQKKVVGARELFLVNIPAMLMAAALSFGLAVPTFGVLPEGPWASLLWALCCGVAAFLTRRLFPVRSTFFLWTAPGIGVLLALILGLMMGESWLSWSVSRLSLLRFADLVPLGALATTLAYLLERRRHS